MFVPYSEAYGEGFEDMPRRVPDLTRVQNALGWAPTADLDEIIADVIEHQMTREPAPGGAISTSRRQFEQRRHGGVGTERRPA